MMKEQPNCQHKWIPLLGRVGNKNVPTSLFTCLKCGEMKVGKQTIRISRHRLDMGDKQIKNLADATAAKDAVNKRQLDAHAFALTCFLRAGRFHMWPSGTVTTLGLPANILYAIPFFTPVARTITRIGIHVTVWTEALARLGVYLDTGAIYPGSLVWDAGAVDLATVGIRQITGLNISLAANTLYWLALVANAAGATISATIGGWLLLGNSTATLNVTASGHWTVGFTYGTLPSTFPAGGTAAETAIPKIAVFF